MSITKYYQLIKIILKKVHTALDKVPNTFNSIQNLRLVSMQFQDTAIQDTTIQLKVLLENRKL